jgi:6,7-dimethyl-8-ribityllumazine synthase
MKIFEGQLNGKDAKIAIVISRFNSLITEQLLKGCIDGLTRNSVSNNDISVYKVPGSFELPLTVKKVANSKKFDAVIALGAVIRGETPHFDYVSSETSKGIAQVSLESGVPIIFGVLTTDTTEQALERAGVKSGNKGFDAALSAIELIDLYKNL